MEGQKSGNLWRRDEVGTLRDEGMEGGEGGGLGDEENNFQR